MDPGSTLRALLRALVTPPLSLLVLALVGVGLAGRRPRLGRALAGFGIGVVLAMSLPVVADSLSAVVEAYPPLRLDRAQEAGAIVVLSGGTRWGPVGDDREYVSTSTLERLSAAVRYARATGLPLLLSGGVVGGAKAESEIMRQHLEREFLLEPRWLETVSRNTAENARESARILAAEGIGRIVLVTSANHMRRAVWLFEAEGLDVIPAPVGAARRPRVRAVDWMPSAGALGQSAAACHELLGLAATWARR